MIIPSEMVKVAFLAIQTASASNKGIDAVREVLTQAYNLAIDAAATEAHDSQQDCFCDLPEHRWQGQAGVLPCPACMEAARIEGRIRAKRIEDVPGNQLQDCVDRTPPTWSGHWREYHRGHGCKQDPEAT